jgi:protein SCO1/2
MIRAFCQATLRRPARFAVVGMLMVAATACGADTTTTRAMVGYAPSGAQPVAAVSLPDAANGDAEFAFRAQADHLLVVYFGYTACPDVCPTTLAALKVAKNGLGDDGARVDVAMATVDPDRDTDAVLTGYVQSFIDGAHALRTDDASALRSAGDAFGVSYEVTTQADGTVDVSHSGSTYVVDDVGNVVLTWPFGVTATDMQGDLAQLLDHVAA